MYFIDVEIYSNYFLLSALSSSGEIKHFELYEGKELERKGLKDLFKNNLTISFNGLNFDLPLISLAVSSATVEKIKKVADKIIKTNTAGWKIYDLYCIEKIQSDHIDLIEVSPGRSSLKIYGGRLHAPTIQDLPFDPDHVVSPEERKTIRDYCVNDLHTTKLLYNALKKQIDLRVAMSEQYGIDLRSKSDAQIAETIIKSELKKLTGKHYGKVDLDKNKFRYQNPKIISFKTKELISIFDKILKTDFEIGGNGSVVMPEWLRDQKIKIGNTEYQMGIGGLHSCEKSQFVTADDYYVLMDKDVASFYPSILLQQNLPPSAIGFPFLAVYRDLVVRRLRAKKKGDKVEAETLKIACNGSYGKLGSKYSFLYAPELLIQTTITGQLSLLMLIERLEHYGISVISANTDGIVIYTKKENEKLVDEICFDWMLDTSFELETAYYKTLASRDVNNYVAIKKDGSVKGKGCFGGGSLAKNPDTAIIYDAVTEHLKSGVEVSDYIKSCKDITKFVIVRRVQGGAVWNGEYLGKTVRFYYSIQFSSDEYIQYKTNSNKVPKSASSKPLMTLPESIPDDVDYERYIGEAYKLLEEVGAC